MSAVNSTVTARASSTEALIASGSEPDLRRAAATSRSTSRPSAMLAGVAPRLARNALHVLSST